MEVSVDFSKKLEFSSVQCGFNEVAITLRDDHDNLEIVLTRGQLESFKKFLNGVSMVE